MNIITKNKILLCISQLGAWVLLIILILNRSLNKLLFPTVNNRPAAFAISIWLIQTLVVMNVIVFIVNQIWIRSSDKNKKSEIKLQSKKIASLHILVSVFHVILFCVLFLLIFGGEDL